ncbi:MAG: SapC family protein [Caulobacteraceae bacterium]|nr:SapC family protein [Caulobacteraceae bacterium]
MATFPPPANAPVSGNALFYSRPEPLNAQVHAKLGLRKIEKPFMFASTHQAIPVTVGEFVPASLSFPIIFAGDKRQPLGVMGLEANTNMFIQANGYFDTGVYVPAYIRRYPFVLANDESRQQFVVCIDRDAEMLGDLPDLPFFDPSGQPTDYTKGCIQFCNDYEVEVKRTESFIDLLNGLDLLETRKTTYTPANPDGTPGTPQDIAEYYAVSEDRLKALPNEKLRELMDNGALKQIFAHINSLAGWDKLISMAITRQQAAAATFN